MNCWLLVLLLSHLAVGQNLFPISQTQLLDSDQHFLFTTAQNTKNVDELLRVTAKHFPDWRFVVLPKSQILESQIFAYLDLQTFTFRDKRVSDFSADATRQGLIQHLDYTTLGLFRQPFGPEDYPINERPVIILRSTTSREVVLREILAALFSRAKEASKVDDDPSEMSDQTFSLEGTQPGTLARGIAELKIANQQLEQSTREVGEPLDIALFLRHQKNNFNLSKPIVDHLLEEISVWPLHTSMKQALKKLSEWRPRKFESAALFEAERTLLYNVARIQSAVTDTSPLLYPATLDCGNTLKFERKK